MLKLLIAEYEDLKKEYSMKVQGEFEKLLKHFQEEIPKEVELSWTQFTPSYNDGDPCYFIVNSEIAITCGDEYFEDPLDLCERTDKGKYVVREGDIEGTKISFKQVFHLAEVLSDLIYSIPKEILEDCYGDGVMVTVSRENVEVEEHEHC